MPVSKRGEHIDACINLTSNACMNRTEVSLSFLGIWHCWWHLNYQIHEQVQEWMGLWTTRQSTAGKRPDMAASTADDDDFGDFCDADVSALALCTPAAPADVSNSDFGNVGSMLWQLPGNAASVEISAKATPWRTNVHQCSIPSSSGSHAVAGSSLLEASALHGFGVAAAPQPSADSFPAASPFPVPARSESSGSGFPTAAWAAANSEPDPKVARQPSFGQLQFSHRVTPASVLSIAREEFNASEDDDFGDFEDAQPHTSVERSVQEHLPPEQVLHDR